MSLLLVAFDLDHHPVRNYHQLWAYLESCPGSLRVYEQVWLISTEQPTEQLERELRVRIDWVDKVLIVEVRNASASGLGPFGTTRLADFLDQDRQEAEQAKRAG